VDVSQWDGLTDIDEPESYPFYHIMTDSKDCIEAFGSERPFRYVCEANLEPCPPDGGADLHIPDFDWEHAAQEGRYDPPNRVKFKFGVPFENDKVLEAGAIAIYQEILNFQQCQKSEVRDSQEEVARIAESMSLDILFELLEVCDTMEMAMVVGETIKSIFKAHGDADIRQKMDDGIADLVFIWGDNKGEALATFQEVLREDDTYAEAWNKVSTCQFMLGDLQASLWAARRTLELEPRHYQAQNGLGLVFHEMKQYHNAADSFRQSLAIHPWSSSSTRLAACLDIIAQLEEEEGSAPQ